MYLKFRLFLNFNIINTNLKNEILKIYKEKQYNILQKYNIKNYIKETEEEIAL